jgi:ketosteroid isomerase-like protein
MSTLQAGAGIAAAIDEVSLVRLDSPVDQPCVAILDFRGDRIWRNRVYLDRAEGLRAAGLSE